MRVLEKASTELNELRLRVQHLEKRQELSRGDVLLPDVTARILVDQWLDAGMTREAWALVQDALAPVMTAKLHDAYKAANEFLVASGVMKEIDLQALVRRAPGARSEGPPGAPPQSRPVGARVPPSGAAHPAGASAGFRQAAGPGAEPGAHQNVSPSGLGGSSPSGRSSATGVSGAGVQDETRMMTGASPLARARMRAQGVVGRLRRMLIEKVGGDFEATQILPPSPGLAQAMQRVVPGDSAGAGFYVSGNSRPGACTWTPPMWRRPPWCCASARPSSSRPPARPRRKPPSRWWPSCSRASWPRSAFRRACGCGSRACRFRCCGSPWPNPSFSAPCSTPPAD